MHTHDLGHILFYIVFTDRTTLVSESQVEHSKMPQVLANINIQIRRQLFG
jgi:hypothetical protein